MFKAKKSSDAPNRRQQAYASPAGPQAERPHDQHSIIPANLQISGNLVSTGDIHVEGVIHGNITCRTLTLAGQPVVKGSITAETVRICGSFDGELEAKKVVLTKTARMTGSILYEVLEIEPEASFEGEISRRKIVSREVV